MEFNAAKDSLLSCGICQCSVLFECLDSWLGHHDMHSTLNAFHGDGEVGVIRCENNCDVTGLSRSNMHQFHDARRLMGICIFRTLKLAAAVLNASGSTTPSSGQVSMTEGSIPS